MKMKKFFAFIADILPMIFFVTGLLTTVNSIVDFNQILGGIATGLAFMLMAFLFGKND